MKQIINDMLCDLQEEPNISKEAREFFEYFLKYPEELEKMNKLLVNGESTLKVSNILADFIEEVSETEAENILLSIYKVRTEEEFKEVSRLFKKRWSSM